MPIPVQPSKVVKRAASLFQPRWLVAGFLAFAAALNYGDRAAMASVLAAVRTDLGLSDVALGYVGSTFLWSYALASPFAGVLADRFPRRKLVTLSLFLWSLTTALTGVASGLAMLVAMRICLGVAESLYLPAAVALLADHHPTTTRGRAMSLHNVGLNMGVVIGGAFAGYLAEHFGWRAGFLVLGALGVLLYFVSGFFLSDPPTVTTKSPARAKLGESLAYLIRVPTFLVMLAKATLVGVGSWTFLSWLPLYFRDNFGMNLGAAGFAGTFMLQISMVAGVAVGGWISDRVAARETARRLKVQALFYFAAAPFLWVFLSHPNFFWVACSIAAFSFVRGVGNANEHPVLCDVIPARFRSTAVGLMNTFGTAAGGVGVLLTGMLKAGFGLNAVFAGISIVFLFAAAIMLLAYRVWIRGDLARAARYEGQA